MMNRELKFRIWDPKAGNWFWKPDELGNIIYCDDWDMFDPYDYQFDQFTGLKDKNGDEIYENDIVELDPDDNDPYKVIFNEGKFEIENSIVNYDLGEEYMDCEIIGNIHENDDLLEAE